MFARPAVQRTRVRRSRAIRPFRTRRPRVRGGVRRGSEPMPLTSLTVDDAVSGWLWESAVSGVSRAADVGGPCRAGAVAVGTALAGRPPHRSQRADFPHWAPTSGQTRRRSHGQGCWMRGKGKARARTTMRFQVSLVRWLRRRKARYHRPTSRKRNEVIAREFEGTP